MMYKNPYEYWELGMGRRIRELFENQPAIITAVVEAALAVFVAFGLEWTVEQVATVMALVNIVGGVIVFMVVMPMSKARQIIAERDTAFEQAEFARDMQRAAEAELTLARNPSSPETREDPFA